HAGHRHCAENRPGSEKSRGGMRALSAVVPTESNYLLNPAHEDFRRCVWGNRAFRIRSAVGLNFALDALRSCIAAKQSKYPLVAILKGRFTQVSQSGNTEMSSFLRTPLPR